MPDEKKHNTTKELPAELRPYDRCLMYGAEQLTDAELLAAILQTGSRGLNSLETAELILRSCREKGGLCGLYRMTVQEFCEIPGIGTAKAARLCCIGELSRRMAASAASRTRRFCRPSDIADYYMERLRQQEQEYVWCLMLDTKNSFLGERMISMGTVNASLVSPREIFFSALSCRAVSIALVHNHPSGDPQPSSEDILLTRRVQQAGELLGIHLLDHVVIGEGCFTSILEYME
ncbi:MAG: DNA repair protein RadC [Lachnospiraceae bacterium]|nr:DNA repair protein RadC [Lachnospiraceae bacterium]